MQTEASGTFAVELSPVATADDPIGRMTIAKTFHGDLDATSVGHMLAFRSDVAGSAGYVAMERVTGMLHGRRGAFTLRHGGSMDRGTSTLHITMVPDLATDGLAGMTGTMEIIAAAGRHDYRLRYTLPD